MANDPDIPGELPQILRTHEETIESMRPGTKLPILGPPGSGKSRLAMDIATDYADMHFGIEEPFIVDWDVYRIHQKLIAEKAKPKSVRGPSSLEDLLELAKLKRSRSQPTILIIDGADVAQEHPEFVDELVAVTRRVSRENGIVIVTAQRHAPWMDELDQTMHLAEDRLEGLNLPPVEIYIDPGNASTETLQEAFQALSDLQVAAGGFGLEFKTDGNSIFEISEVQQ